MSKNSSQPKTTGEDQFHMQIFKSSHFKNWKIVPFEEEMVKTNNFSPLLLTTKLSVYLKILQDRRHYD